MTWSQGERSYRSRSAHYIGKELILTIKPDPCRERGRPVRTERAARTTVSAQGSGTNEASLYRSADVPSALSAQRERVPLARELSVLCTLVRTGRPRSQHLVEKISSNKIMLIRARYSLLTHASWAFCGEFIEGENAFERSAWGRRFAGP